MFLSKLGYSELVQRIFEKMTFFLVDPNCIFQGAVGGEAQDRKGQDEDGGRGHVRCPEQPGHYPQPRCSTRQKA